MRLAMIAFGNGVLVATVLVLPTSASATLAAAEHTGVVALAPTDEPTSPTPSSSSSSSSGMSWPTVIAACLGVLVGGVLARRRIKNQS